MIQTYKKSNYLQAYLEIPKMKFLASNPSHLVKDLQIEGVYPRRHSALNNFIPARILCPIVCSWSFIDSIAQSHPTVGVHAGHTIVLSQLCLDQNLDQKQDLITI